MSGSPIPGHRAITLSGFHSYPDRESVRAGETIHFHTSSTVPYVTEIRRLGLLVDDRSSDAVLAKLPESSSRTQPIHPGSYIHAEGVRPWEAITALTLECWVRPAKVLGWTGLVTQHDYPSTCSFGIFLTPEGAIALYLGDGGAYGRGVDLRSRDERVTQEMWHHIVGVWDGTAAWIYHNGAPILGPVVFRGPVKGSTCPLRVGAYGAHGLADQFLNGEIAMPAIYGRALSATEIATRHSDKAQTVPRGSLLACWPLDEERGSQARDVGPSHRHGRIINYGCWMVGGPRFDARAVNQFSPYDPEADPTRGHALRLASDDLYDCGWRATESFTVPAQAKSGFHVARFTYTLNGKTEEYEVTFVVRRGPSQPRPEIVVLANTNTWRAYNDDPMPGNSVRDVPRYSFYLGHPAAGLPTYYVGRRLPLPSADPEARYQSPEYSHLVRAEWFTHAWLERCGYRYDVITDFDLDQEPEVLAGYKVLVLAGHAEYWSLPMYKNVERWLSSGGTLLSLTGNAIWWRVSYDDDGTRIECRKTDGNLGGTGDGRHGEAWHSQDGARGGLMHHCGYPAPRLIGLLFLAWTAPDTPDGFTPYIAKEPMHPLFQTPLATGLTMDAVFGQAPTGLLPRAVGHEFDVTVATLNALQTASTPPGAVRPNPDPGIVVLATSKTNAGARGMAFDYHGQQIKPPPEQGAEMIYWERPAGGRVFNAGSVGSGWTLGADGTLATIVKNVLSHFGVSAPPRLSGISFNPSAVRGGTSSTGAVTLIGQAPAGGLPVALVCSHPSVVVPAWVVVAAGASTVRFSAGTNSVSSEIVAWISASACDERRRASLTVLPAGAVP